MEDINDKLLISIRKNARAAKTVSFACSFHHEKDFRPGCNSHPCFYVGERRNIRTMMCQQWRRCSLVSRCAHRRHAPTTGAGVWIGHEKMHPLRMCTQACHFGNAVYDVLTNSILKCDECQGDPACVRMCPNKALDFIEDTIINTFKY